MQYDEVNNVNYKINNKIIKSNDYLIEIIYY